MEFQFGTNWATYSRFVGDVFGSATGRRGDLRLLPRVRLPGGAALRLGQGRPADALLRHLMVALGAHFSAIWIIVANSWQQTPAAYHIVDRASRPPRRDPQLLGRRLQPQHPRPPRPHPHGRLAGRRVLRDLASRLLPAQAGTTRTSPGRSMKIALVVAALASLGQLVTGHTSADRRRRATSRPSWPPSRAIYETGSRPTSRCRLGRRGERDRSSGSRSRACSAGWCTATPTPVIRA